MKKQDRQGVRTVAELERKYAIGKSFQKAGEVARLAQQQAQNASAGIAQMDKSVQEAKRLAKEASDEVKKLLESMELTVENGAVTAQIVLKMGDIELRRTVDMQGLAAVEDLKTPGAAEVHGENISGQILLADGDRRYTEVSPEGVRMWLPEAEEIPEEAARAELTPTALVFPLGGGRVSGIAQPEEDTDAVNKGYLEEYVAQALDKLREELTNKDTETDDQE
ncbi:MAG: hypothetical protein IJA45_09485 [Oscillospiraceae bacterium]|nr:hypothetical protein [Oscillospiraceae bacterium]